MNIGSGNSYPANSLSNFAPHPFELDGVQINSMEAWLQSLKFKSVEMQEEVCKLVGRGAKFKGKHKKWYINQKLYWRGKEIDRHSKEYQLLLDRAYEALSKNKKFRAALLASGNSVLTHSIGKSDSSKTILTTREFCSRLTRIREKLKNEKSLF